MAVAHTFASRGAVFSLTLIFAAPVVRVGAQETPIALVPHRAIYDLSLGETRGNSQIAGVRGRILYDFDGSACQGYSLEFRQVSELDTGEGKVSHQRSALDDVGRRRRQELQIHLGKFRRRESGRLGRRPCRAWQRATAVDLAKPEHKVLDLDAGVVFPTEHMVRVIAAARAGKTILDFPVYDGSETGDKVFDTLTVIGQKLAPNERKHADAAADEPKLADVPRWPVTISYFDKTEKAKIGEQTPAYAIGFELYENGISRALSLDYNDFVVTGKLTSLEIKDAKPCP